MLDTIPGAFSPLSPQNWLSFICIFGSEYARGTPGLSPLEFLMIGCRSHAGPTDPPLLEEELGDCTTFFFFMIEKDWK